MTLGAAFGLGLLAKWNFVIFAAALPLACLLHPRFKRLVLTWRIVPAALVAAIIVLPTIIAALAIGPAAGDELGAVLGDEPGFSVQHLAEGTFRLVKAAIVYPQPLLALVALVLGAPLWRGLHSRVRDVSAGRPDAALIATTMAVSLALYWAAVPLLGAEEFRERLMQPALFILPVWLFMLIERGRPSAWALNLLALLLALLVVGAFAARAALYLRGADHCSSCRGDGAVRGACGGIAGSRILRPRHDRFGGHAYQRQHARALPGGADRRRLFSRGGMASARPAGRSACSSGRSGRIQDKPGAPLTKYELTSPQALGGVPEAPHRAGTASANMFGSTTRQYALSYRLYDAPNGDCR